MKRNQFLQGVLAAAAIIASPFPSLARRVRDYREKAGFKVDAGKGRMDAKISLFDGDTFSTKVSSKDTDNDLYVFESSRVKEGGPSHHYHFEQDEWWYILSGKFLFKIGEQTFEGVAGDSFFGPRMVPHSFAKVGEEEGKLLMYFQPAGKMEEFFRKISEGAAKGMTEEEQDKFREAHGFKRVGPPIKNLKF